MPFSATTWTAKTKRRSGSGWPMSIWRPSARESSPASSIGEPSRRVPGAFAVQGVAVDLTPAKQCARRGIGSALLRAFGREAASLGYRLLDVGAADDERVERFYLKNGFLPYELVAKGTDGLERARAPIADYREGKRLQHELRNRHEAGEVIFIFRKPLPFA